MRKTYTYIIILFFAITYGYCQSNKTVSVDFTHEVVYKVIDTDTLKLQVYNPNKFDDSKKQT